MAFLQGRKVAGFVVRRAIDLAAEEDTDPFEGERPEGGVMGGPLGLVGVVELFRLPGVVCGSDR